MGVGKIVVSLVSIILLVGVVIGVVMVVNKGGNHKGGKDTKVQKKKVEDFCQVADFKDACTKSLEGVAQNESATIGDYVMAAFKNTVEEVKKGIDEAGKASVDKEKDPYNHMAVEDCKKFLQFAVEVLEKSLSLVAETDTESLHEYTNDLLNWVGAVYSYQTVCVDQLTSPEYKSLIEKSLTNATQLSNNAINIVAKMSEVLKSFNIQIPEGLLDNTSSSPHRRLLDFNKVDKDGYPTWFPAADRKLLEKTSKGKGKEGGAPGAVTPLPPLGPGPVTPHAVVAKDGSGKFKTVQEAINSYPPNHQGRYIIYIKAGVYEEHILIKKMPNIFMYGDGAGKSIITSDKSVAITKLTTSQSATVGVDSDRFLAKGLTFRNTAGALGEQAVALRINGDASAVFDCSIEGYQDTLYYHAFRQFYRNCVISGTIDFIFGNGAAVIQDSEIILRRPKSENCVTADGKEVQDKMSGVVLQNCKIVADQEYYPDRLKMKNYLARPWKKFSTNVFLENEIDDLIIPEGYMRWTGQGGEKNHETSFMYEYGNRGPGAATNGRSKLFTNFKVLSPQEAAKFTAAAFIQGSEWLPATTAPFYLGLGGK